MIETSTQTRLEGIYEILLDNVQNHGDAPALLGPGRALISHSQLLLECNSLIEHLTSLGVTKKDIVMVALPNGPETVTALLAVASLAICAPVDSQVSQRGLSAFVAKVKPKIIIVGNDNASPVLDISEDLGIPTIEMPQATSSMATGASMPPEARSRKTLAIRRDKDDIAFLLLTSGTTGRPKVVPITQKNICIGAYNICDAMQLRSSDRLLSVMRLHHIAGIALVLATLARGGSVFCAPTFLPTEFPQLMEECQPTWFWASPAILQSLVQNMHGEHPVPGVTNLRFIRVGSSALSVSLRGEAERLFGVPVVENYGLTEASPQVTCCSLLPTGRTPRSVGKSAGPEVAIMDAQGRILSHGQVGEVVIRGENVIRAYWEDPESTRRAFVAGWFKTGDLGYLDQEGYLFLTGRIKELISHGGEKISPLEIDQVLMEHPAVLQAVCFPVPNSVYGEDVAAAVILRSGCSTSERELKAFCGNRLEFFKIPKKILFVDDIPREPGGKTKRSELYRKFRLTPFESSGEKLQHSCVPPQSPIEISLEGIWRSVLGLKEVGIDADFFDLGGTSIRAATLISQIGKVFGCTLPVVTLLSASTIRLLAEVVATRSEANESKPIIELRAGLGQPPLFLVHSIGGNVLAYRELADRLNTGHPIYALQAVGLNEGETPFTSIEEMAAHHVAELRRVQPHGPYCVGGASFGGVVAYEMARQLYEMGEQVPLLVLIDSFARGFFKILSTMTRLKYKFDINLSRTRYHVHNLFSGDGGLTYFGRFTSNVRSAAKERIQRIAFNSERNARHRFPDRLALVWRANRIASAKYVPKPYGGQILLFRATQGLVGVVPEKDLGWSRLAQGGVQIVELPGDHLSILSDPAVKAMAETLGKLLREVARDGDNDDPSP